jgi:hypothetical protein
MCQGNYKPDIFYSDGVDLLRTYARYLLEQGRITC